MYTKQRDSRIVPLSAEEDSETVVESWSIQDPDGDHIVWVDDEDAADTLLSHLNR